jgi:hypothetical protein
MPLTILGSLAKLLSRCLRKKSSRVEAFLTRAEAAAGQGQPGGQRHRAAWFNFALIKGDVAADDDLLLSSSCTRYERERHGYIERRERTGKREGEAHTRTPTRVKRPGQPH